MSTIDSDAFLGSVYRLVDEIFNGAAPGVPAWILNPGEIGLLASVSRLTAEQASARLIPERATLAAHVNHLRFSLDLLNRWAQGEEPYADANWQESWQIQFVTEEEWKNLRKSLQSEVVAWLKAVRMPRDLDEITLTGVMASAVHAAYHFGAIRQVLGLLNHDRV